MRPQLFPRHKSSDFDFDFSDTPNCGRGTLLSDKNADLGSNQSHEHALPNLFQIKQLNHSWLWFVFKVRLEHHFGIFIWQIILHQFASSEFREYFYSVIFEISDKQMQFAELKNTPKQKKN